MAGDFNKDGLGIAFATDHFPTMLPRNGRDSFHILGVKEVGVDPLISFNVILFFEYSEHDLCEGQRHMANLTGEWVGEYFENQRGHGITAGLVQKGETLTGWMRDEETDQEMSVSDATGAIGEAPGMDERVVAKLRQMVPDADDAPIRYISHLPEASSLAGWVRGEGVYFLKSYQGVAYGGYRVGEKLVGVGKSDHTVNYSGRLNVSGDEFEGKWWINATDEPGSRRTEGSFLLRRRV